MQTHEWNSVWSLQHLGEIGNYKSKQSPFRNVHVFEKRAVSEIRWQDLKPLKAVRKLEAVAS